MFGLDKIPEFTKLIGMAERAISLLEIFTRNTGVKETWKNTGKIGGTLDIEQYKIVFIIEDTQKTAIPVKPEEPNGSN